MSPPHPRIHETMSGQIGIMVLSAVVSAYVVAPELRPALDVAAPALLAMLPAAMAGVCARVATEMFGGERWYWRSAEPYKTLGLGLISALMAYVIVQQALGARVAAEGWPAIWVTLLQLGAVAAVMLAGYAGLHDGDDRTWRRRNHLE